MAVVGGLAGFAGILVAVASGWSPPRDPSSNSLVVEYWLADLAKGSKVRVSFALQLGADGAYLHHPTAIEFVPWSEVRSVQAMPRLGLVSFDCGGVSKEAHCSVDRMTETVHIAEQMAQRHGGMPRRSTP